MDDDFFEDDQPIDEILAIVNDPNKPVFKTAPPPSNFYWSPASGTARVPITETLGWCYVRPIT
jgi:hypothetical protein